MASLAGRKALDAEIVAPLDVRDAAPMEALFAEIAGRWGRLDVLLRAIAFRPREDPRGRVMDCSAEGFAVAMGVSVRALSPGPLGTAAASGVAGRGAPMRDETAADLSPMSFLRPAARDPALDPGARIAAAAGAPPAATNPDLNGAIVLNGAPVAQWSGEAGGNPMRRDGGVLGGADLVQNVAMPSPGRSHFSKHHDLFTGIDHGERRRLAFERWRGGFFKLNEEEVRWIVETLFVGKALARSEAHPEPGRVVDVEPARSPTIVVASHGDDITPPRQALNRIVDADADAREIKIRGRRITDMAHEEVGHLGIFVSASIARNEHAAVASTLNTLEAPAGGSCERQVDAAAGAGRDRPFIVSFAERGLRDIEAADDGREDAEAFAAVGRLSAAQARSCDVTARPLVKAMVCAPGAGAAQALRPLRTQRATLSSRDPLTAPVKAMAGAVAARREPAPRDTPFMLTEQAMAGMFAQSVDRMRDAMCGAGRAPAARAARYAPGPVDETAPRRLEMLRRFHEALRPPMFTDDAPEDPPAVAELEAVQ